MAPRRALKASGPNELTDLFDAVDVSAVPDKPDRIAMIGSRH
jgi:hypothetical protein